LGTLINRTNDSGDSEFSLEKLLGSITGGKSDELTSQSQQGGLQDLLRHLGDEQQGSGWMDVVKTLAGGAQQQQQRNGGGGLMDLINGYLK
jgi:hypothetical protein